MKLYFLTIISFLNISFAASQKIDIKESSQRRVVLPFDSVDIQYFLKFKNIRQLTKKDYILRSGIPFSGVLINRVNYGYNETPFKTFIDNTVSDRFFNYSDLKELILQGKVTKSTKLWNGSMEKWTEAGKIDKLKLLFDYSEIPTFLSDVAYVSNGRVDSIFLYYYGDKIKAKQYFSENYFTTEEFYENGQLEKKATVSYIQPSTAESRNSTVFPFSEYSGFVEKGFRTFGEFEYYNNDGSIYAIGKYIDKAKGAFQIKKYEKYKLKQQFDFTGKKSKTATSVEWEMYERYFDDVGLSKLYHRYNGITKSLDVNSVKDQANTEKSVNQKLAGVSSTSWDGTKATKEVCLLCDGKGRIYGCSNCSKVGRVHCSKCSGRKYTADGRVCLTCSGIGILTCGTCKGKPGQYSVECWSCDGCKTVISRKVQCNVCQGSGVGYKTIGRPTEEWKEFGQTKTVLAKCYSCDGKKFVIKSNPSCK